MCGGAAESTYTEYLYSALIRSRRLCYHSACACVVQSTAEQSRAGMRPPSTLSWRPPRLATRLSQLASSPPCRSHHDRSSRTIRTGERARRPGQDVSCGQEGARVWGERLAVISPAQYFMRPDGRAPALHRALCSGTGLAGWLSSCFSRDDGVCKSSDQHVQIQPLSDYCCPEARPS